MELNFYKINNFKWNIIGYIYENKIFFYEWNVMRCYIVLFFIIMFKFKVIIIVFKYKWC